MLEQANITTQFCRLMATDLYVLADLHAVELTVERMRELQALEFPSILALNSDDQAYLLTVQQMESCLREWGKLPDSLVDDLASDFADIYLNGKFHSSPNESVWLDEEELVCQQPMFQVREWYAGHDLEVPNWRRMPDDHLVNELLFVAALLNKAAVDHPTQILSDAACFMDEHLLRWLLPFGKRVADRCNTPFYAALALLTALYVEQLRDLLAGILNAPRPSYEEIEGRMHAHHHLASRPEPIRYYPGIAPSW